MGGHNVRDSALELLRGGALPDHVAEGLLSRHLRIAPTPGHTALGIEPHQPLRSFGDAANDVGAGIEVVAARVAKYDDGGLRRHAFHPLPLEVGKRSAIVGGPETDFG